MSGLGFRRLGVQSLPCHAAFEKPRVASWRPFCKDVDVSRTLLEDWSHDKKGYSKTLKPG